MNDSKATNDFKEKVSELLEMVARELNPSGHGAYAGAEEGNVLEHTTRRFFIDGLVEALGWTLGPDGDIVEEARIKAETVTFMDYVGLSTTTAAPLVVIEAKAWDKPFISARDRRSRSSEASLVVEAIQYLKGGGAKARSPVSTLWHDYLDQLRGYVNKFRLQHGHEVVRAVLTNGQWTIVFISPSKTFADDGVIDDQQFHIFKRETLVADAHHLYYLLNQRTIANAVPHPLRPSQLTAYVSAASIKAAFYGLHVRYEKSGTSLFVRKPRILVYPALIIQRSDDALLTAMSGDEEFAVDYQEERGLTSHLAEVAAATGVLRTQCSELVGLNIAPSELDAFPGFSPEAFRRDAGTRRILVKQFSEPNEFLVVTGSATHYLRAKPIIAPCRFHEWSECRSIGQAIGTRSINTRSVQDPRSFFTDSEDHHCGHQGLDDKREAKCHIRGIDERICCQACVFLATCWPVGGSSPLPCGT